MNKLYRIIEKQIRNFFFSGFLFLFSSAIFVIGSEDSKAIVPDTKGKDFWVTYMPNFHNNARSDIVYEKYGDSLYLFITSEVPTSGTITYKDIQGRPFTHNFSIPDPKKIYVFKVSWYNFELRGFNSSGELTDEHQCEVSAPQVFHVVTDNDVTIYGHSQAVTTSDAFNVMPADALGKDYFVMAYKSDGKRDGTMISGSSTPSQFAIVAPYDSTTITINPTAATYVHGKQKFSVTLNKGEAYLVQARITVSNINSDLTGTEINSDKPIAVFGGHQRSCIPVQNSFSPSRDFLCSQMIPIQSWGVQAIITPFPQPNNINTTYNDVYRILAAYDNTKLYYDDVYFETINKGQYYEGDLLEAATLKASAPILVSVYKRTSDDNPSMDIVSDPLMMIIPQTEQFNNFYRFINIQSYEYSYMDMNNRPVFNMVYTEQYLTIVAPEKTLDSIVLDNVLVPRNRFRQIANTEYYYAIIENMRDGVHTLVSKHPVGIYVYGYGIANSYGYFGGMNFQLLDVHPPQNQITRDCYKVEGYFSDSTYNDSKIKELTIAPNSLVNVDVSVGDFSPYQSVVTYSAVLINKFRDGAFLIKCIDSVGLETEELIEIPGFTVNAIDDDENPDLPLYEKEYNADREYCFEITLHNYGKFAQNIENVQLSDRLGILSIKTNFPQLIQPGQVLKVKICALADTVITISDTLIINGDCDPRAVYKFNFAFKKDVAKPQWNGKRDPCNTFVNLIVTDSLGSDNGLASIKVDTLDNCRLENEQQFNSRISKLTVFIIDRYKDAYFRIRATDSAGNVSVYEEHIPGFTIEFSDFGTVSNTHSFGAKTIGKLMCDSLRLYNYGRYTITLNDAYIFRNTLFSVPQSQFPFVLPPGETKNLYVCYKPVNSTEGKNTDTVEITYNCLKKSVALEGDPLPLERNTESSCNVPLKMLAKKVPHNYFLEQNFPNPAETVTSFVIGIPEKTEAELNIYDMNGEIVFSTQMGMLEAGIYSIDADLSGLRSGIYFYELQSGSARLTRKLTVAK